MNNLERDVRFLKFYSALTTLILAVLALSAFTAAGKKEKFGEIDVQRINLVEPDGKVDLVISNRSLFPAPLVNGRTGKRQGTASPGMLFYNQQGDEDGGFVWEGGPTRDGYYAGASITFDQYKQDQTLGITYSDTNGKRAAGFSVWDRPETPLTATMDRFAEIEKMTDSSARASAIQKLKDAGEYGRTRIYLGKDADKSAMLYMADTNGRARLIVKVDGNGNPTLKFLDEHGKKIYSLPPSK